MTSYVRAKGGGDGPGGVIDVEGRSNLIVYQHNNIEKGRYYVEYKQ